ncbi:MAG: YmdB family metallophosphoesterase [Treponema sp.]
MKLLYIASIVGKPGLFTVKYTLPSLQEKYKPDIIIANANMASGTGGLQKAHAVSLRKMGIDVITGGEYIFSKKDLVESLELMPYVLRPFNLSSMSPGVGVIQKGDATIISVLGMIGQYKMLVNNPFTLIEDLVDNIKTKTIIIDFVSYATAEKKTLFFMLKGRVSAIIGNGTLVATNDLDIYGESDSKTAYITDAGRTGSYNSVSGYIPSYKIEEYLTCLPNYPRDCWNSLALQGVFIEFDEKGVAIRTERVFEECKDEKRRNGYKNN